MHWFIFDIFLGYLWFTQVQAAKHTLRNNFPQQVLRVFRGARRPDSCSRLYP